MAQTTEAACLLKSGATYPRRLGLRLGHVDLFVGVKPGGVSIYFGDAPIYHFDLDGRWQRAFVDGTHYLKGLDAKVRSIDRDREAGALVLQRGTLPYAEAADLDASIRTVALGLIADLDDGRLAIQPTPSQARQFEPEEFRDFLERVAGWDSAAWFAHREHYLANYGPLPFLPPDFPNALVLQATLGDRNGRAFGRARPAEHYARSPSEFLDHTRAVAKLVGRRIAQHRGFFLGGADVLLRPLVETLENLEAIREVFPVHPPGNRWDDFPGKVGPVQAFLDDFTGLLPDLDAWKTLHASGLAQVTLGVESRDSRFRADRGKDWKENDLRDLIANLKAAKIGVGVVFLVGAGGPVAAARQVEETKALLESLPLGRGDLVTLVDAQTLEAAPAEGNGFVSNSAAAQVAALRSARGETGPKVVAYNPLKRWS